MKASLARAACVVALASASVAVVGVRPAAAACSVSAVSGVAFGPYDVFGTNPVDSTGRFRWRCDGGTHPPVRITLTKGGSTTYLPRKLSGSADQLPYNLYVDSARTNIWGDESEGTRAYYASYPGSGWVNVTVFGRIPPGQDVAVGAYADTITVVVNF